MHEIKQNRSSNYYVFRHFFSNKNHIFTEYTKIYNNKKIFNKYDQ